MSALSTLAKVAARTVEDKARQLAEREVQLQQLVAQLGVLEARRETELMASGRDFAAARQFAPYLQRIANEARTIEASISALETEIATTRDDLSLAYQQQAKFDQVLALEAVRVAKKQEKAIQDQSDELSVQRHTR